MAGKELKVSDVYEQAVSIGQDIESVIQEYGDHAVESVMPKLIELLDTMENLVVRHNDGKSKITALLLEREDLMNQHDASERKKRELEKKIEGAEYLVKTSERKMLRDIKFLKDENRNMSKDLKKRKKKIKKLSKGKEQNIFMWLIDKTMFGGSIYFMTKQFPRDAKQISNLSNKIEEQSRKIKRLSSQVEMKNKHKAFLTRNTARHSYPNNYLNEEVSAKIFSTEDIAQLSYPNDYLDGEISAERFSTKNVARHSYPNDYLDGETSAERFSTKNIARHSYPNDYLNEETSEKRFSTKNMCHSCADNYMDDEKVANENAKKYISRHSFGNGCLDGISYDRKCSIRRIKPNNYEVTVDIHTNRKDYKKLIAKGVQRDPCNFECEERNTISSKNAISSSDLEEYRLVTYSKKNVDQNLETYSCSGISKNSMHLPPLPANNNKVMLRLRPCYDEFEATSSEASTSDIFDESCYWNGCSRSTNDEDDSDISSCVSVVDKMTEKQLCFTLDEKHGLVEYSYSKNLRARKANSWPRLSIPCTLDGGACKD